jgi:type IV secretion system protein VirB1
VIKESQQFWSPATQGQVWRDVIVPRSLRGMVAVFAGVVLTTGASVTANAAPWSADSFTRLARRCAPLAAPSTLASIARVESGFDPLMISDNNSKQSFAPNSVAEAARLATQLIAAGHSVDVGLMQINSSNFARAGLTVPAAFDPCRSLAAGAAILAAGYAGGVTHSSQQAALRIALSRYNTGDAQRGFTNGYVARVERAAQRVVPAIDLAANGQTADAPRRTDGSGRALIPQQETAPGASGGPLSWLVWADDSVTPHSDDRAAVRLAPPTAIIADAGQGAAAAVTNYASPETR